MPEPPDIVVYLGALRARISGAVLEGVRGRFRRPCPDCGAPVQRIVLEEHKAGAMTRPAGRNAREARR